MSERSKGIKKKTLRPFHVVRFKTLGKNSVKTKRVYLDTLKRSKSSVSPLTESTKDPVSQTPDNLYICHEVSRKLNRTYKEQKQIELDAWKETRKHLLRVYFEVQAPHLELDINCSACDAPLTDVFRCTDCNPNACLCLQCLEVVHRVCKLHEVEKWQADTFLPYELPATKHFLKRCACRDVRDKVFTLIDDKGRIHRLCHIGICSCEPETSTMLRFGFWPLSPKCPTVGISTKFLDWHFHLMFEGHVSVQAFIDTVKSKENLGVQDLNELDRLKRGECLAEYRVHLTKLRRFPDDVQTPILCSACPKKDGKLFVALDGNFGLVHKSNSGRSTEAPQVADCVFLPQDQVDSYVDSHSRNTKKPGEECSSFQAGDVLRSKNKTGKLINTGVFAACCKHEIPLKIFNLCHGERFAYPVFMLNSFLETTRGLNLELHVLYDIACILKKHLSNQDDAAIYSDIRFAIPAFHSYSHQGDCQIFLNPRRLDGFGMVDGEQLERLWSYLRPFAKITKEQTDSHRLDVLAMALLHYSNKKVIQMDKYLVEKLRKVDAILHTKSEQLSEAITEYKSVNAGELSDEDLINLWRREEIKVLGQKKSIKSIQKKHSKDEYFTKLRNYYAVREQISILERDSDSDTERLLQQLRRLNAELSKLERQLNIGARWKPGEPAFDEALSQYERKKKIELLYKLRAEVVEKEYLMHFRRRYSDGQKASLRITTAIKKSVKSIRSQVELYCSLGFSTNVGSLPNQLQMTDVHTPSAEVFTKLEDQMLNADSTGPSPTAASVGSAVRRNILDAAALIQRAQEEKEMIPLDMANVLGCLMEKHNKLVDMMGQCDLTNRLGVGSKSVIIKTLAALEKKFAAVGEQFSPYLDIGELPRQYMDLTSTYMQNLRYSGSDLESSDESGEDNFDDDDIN